MKKMIFSFRKVTLIAAAVVVMGGLLVACKKDDAVGTPIPAAGLMVFNLAPDQDAVGFALSGNIINNTPLSYTSYNGFYQNIYTGSREIEVFGFMDSVFASSSFNFENNTQYSLFLTGNNGKYQAITVEDALDSNATADKAWVRYINAIPDSSAPQVKISAGGTSVVDESAAFNLVTPFTPVDGGDVTISVNNSDDIAAGRTIQLSNGKAYTVLLVGVPGATDETKKVQIRFIENGTIPSAVTDK
ncbi:MAG: DUF4397 domain-containing protein [Chitinophagaceae bacterium]|nr:DUF4397 domain-containing protein [Chitinophagaceae bacterium]